MRSYFAVLLLLAVVTTVLCEEPSIGVIGNLTIPDDGIVPNVQLIPATTGSAASDIIPSIISMVFFLLVLCITGGPVIIIVLCLGIPIMCITILVSICAAVLPVVITVIVACISALFALLPVFFSFAVSIFVLVAFLAFVVLLIKWWKESDSDEPKRPHSVTVNPIQATGTAGPMPSAPSVFVPSGDITYGQV